MFFDMKGYFYLFLTCHTVLKPTICIQNNSSRLFTAEKFPRWQTEEMGGYLCRSQGREAAARIKFYLGIIATKYLFDTQ